MTSPHPDFAKVEKRTEAERDNLLLLALQSLKPSATSVKIKNVLKIEWL
jgi:hypothetical protein